PGNGPFPPPTRSRARSTRAAPSSAGYVVHADRPPAVPLRRGRARARARARTAPLVGDRARRAHARGRRRARRRGLRPRTPVPARLGRVAARRARAGARLSGGTGARSRRSARARAPALRGGVGRRPGLLARRLPAAPAPPPRGTPWGSE